MKKTLYGALLHLCTCLCIILVTIPFSICWLQFFADKTILSGYETRQLSVIVLFIIAYLFTGRSYEAFSVSSYSIREILFRQFLAITIADGILFIVLWVLLWHFPNLLIALVTLAAQNLCALIFSVFEQKVILRRQQYSTINSLLIYHSEERAETMFQQIDEQKKFRVDKRIPYQEALDHLEILDGYSTVFLRGVYPEERDIIMRYCMLHGISCMIVPRVGEALINGASSFYLFHLPMLRVTSYRPTPEYAFFKRAFDLILSCLMLLVLSPLFLVVAILIHAADKGPVFYKQVRLTMGGKEFKIYKFRSMRIDAEKDGKAVLSSGENDPRITPVGRFLRRFRLDELPQLINIAKGEMSFVGPRPERPEISAEYEKVFPEFRLRCQSKAGLTGIAQVYGKYNTEPYDKLTMDLMYIAHPSILLDIRLLLATAITFFDSESTEGVQTKEKK